MAKIAIIIPSRLSAERLPNKPLKFINNKEMILHVHDVAKSSNVGEVIVATPDQEILDLVKTHRRRRRRRLNATDFLVQR